MDRFAVTREEVNSIHMDLKQLQHVQSGHTERILRLERRQADESAIKAAWSPFPSVLATTPQHGPVSMPPHDDDLDEYESNLIGSLHLPPAEEEPVRRGAASRANSVRFDESALHGSSWGGQNTRHSGEFVRPGSGLSMERSYSHKSDGRHSSAGHSVHSIHSAASVGRASSVGGDASYVTGDREDDSPVGIPEPPPSLFALGSVPSIMRCWLTTEFAHDTLLYADVCTGSRRSTVEFCLLKELGLLDEVEMDFDGNPRVTLPVYLAEAIVAQQATRSRSPSHEIRIPSMTATFEVLNKDSADGMGARKGIRIFIGSDALRAHSADVLLSQNQIVLYGNDRSKLTVPFVRPEDENVFKHICTVNLLPEKLRLNANAAPFVSSERKADKVAPVTVASEEQVSKPINGTATETQTDTGGLDSHDAISPTSHLPSSNKLTPVLMSRTSSEGQIAVQSNKSPAMSDTQSGAKDTIPATGSNGTDSTPSAPRESRRDTSSGIWGSWRQGMTNGTDSKEGGGPLSGYQPAGRSKHMKVLKPPSKSSSSSARTGASYEPAAQSRNSSEPRRRSHGAASTTNTTAGSSTEGGASPMTSGVAARWDAKRVVSNPGPSIGTNTSEAAPKAQTQQASIGKDTRGGAAVLPRSANPIGGASAFSWMKKSATAATSGGDGSG